MEFYHVVTERPMQVGQNIVFDKESHSGVYFRVMEKKNFVDEIYKHPEKYASGELEHHTKVALRELALEEVRISEYPNYPSRMSSLYVSRTLEEAEKWFDFFESLGRPTFQIVKVRVTGNVFEGNANRCFDGTVDKQKNLDLARAYWENDAKADEEYHPVVEVLVDGEIEVLEIIKDTCNDWRFTSAMITVKEVDNNITNIIFDVGMVLIDFCWDQYCRKLGFSEEVIQAFDVNMIHSHIWDQMDEGTIETEKAIAAFIEKMPEYEEEIKTFWEHPEGFVEEYDYAAVLIQELKKRGYRVYLLSNYPYDMYRIHWPLFRFYSLVDGYVVSAVEKLKKPDSAIYRLICERYRLKPEECLFIDDRQENVDAALGIGMQAVRFIGYHELRDFLSL